ncbi:MAG: transposase, partial [Holosporales bacterium]|nr:transposase [Holosporales bacterium]
MSRRKRGGKNREKQRRIVARLHEYIANQRKDFLHKQSRRIANDYDAVCIEDLNMHGMAQSLNFGKSVMDNGWGMFTGFLKYKLEEQGKRLITIDKWFPSSK